MRWIFQGKRTRRARMAQAGLLLFILSMLSLAGGWASYPVAASAPAIDPNGPAISRLTGTSIQKTALPEAVQELDLPDSRAEYPGCLRYPDAVELDYKTDNLELTDIATIATCGWKPDEIVKVTLMEPTGKLLTSQVKAVPARHLKDVYEVDVFFQPGVDAAEGKYRFTLEGSSTLKVNLFYHRPTGARLYALPQDRFQPLRGVLGGQQQLRLQGFLPNEPVRLLAYRFEGSQIKLYGWQDFTVDASGRLIVETDLPEIGQEVEMNYFAYGRETHFVALERFTRDGRGKTRRLDMDLYCPGAQASRLSTPGIARPVTGSALLDLHQQPGFGSRVVAQVPTDSTLRVYGYPKCIDRAYWWKVTLSKPPRFGWVAESFLGKYLVEMTQ